MNNRRVYISSLDTKEYDENFSEIAIDIGSAKIERKSNQILAVSLVKASFPGTMDALPATTVTSTNIEDPISVLAFQHSADGTTFGATQRIYYNQNNTTLNPGANYGSWSLNSNINTIIEQINFINGDTSLSMNSFGNLTMVAGKALKMMVSDTSPRILKALGIVSDTDYTIDSTNSGQKSADAAIACPVIYITCDDLDVNTFSSSSGGILINIIGSIQVDLSENTIGESELLDVTSTTETVYPMSSQLNYTNFALHGAGKSITCKIVDRIHLKLVNDELKPIGTGGKEWNCCLQFDLINSE